MTPPTKDEIVNGNWDSHRIWILREITRQAEALERLERKIDELVTHVVQLQVRSGLWSVVAGGLAGLVPVLTALVFYLLRGPQR